MRLNLFLCGYLPSIHPFLGEVIILLLRCKSSLYILDTSPLSDTWFAL